MGSNKKEALIFTSMMCFCMVVFMSFYNVIIANGLNSRLLTDVAVGLLPALAVALFCDIVVVGRIAKGLAFKIVKPSAPQIRKVLTISCFMVCGMVILMSLYGTLAHFGFGDNFFRHYFSILGLNFICALPLQLLVAGPLTRFLFSRMFPVRTAAPGV
ncbi:DUF2798 domain-containing protein [Paenibacillus sp. FSL P2-0089]|uniref:Preprotein translocase subunit SecE n=1 Tax=Paenibacillus silagei TaxID=1670801 RepID=A0ABS4P0W6_9BACL|nr:DUF2798 domain-containing protein [Paenibacillus silagei]MBP2115943.1 preprotein translocase subunit SecE [Paenibacillus silagei]